MTLRKHHSGFFSNTILLLSVLQSVAVRIAVRVAIGCSRLQSVKLFRPVRVDMTEF